MDPLFMEFVVIVCFLNRPQRAIGSCLSMMNHFVPTCCQENCLLHMRMENWSIFCIVG
ncbi:hypothetical protein KSP40_PGU000458 [Platanthera guangdongensis]|uniref:Uncharacterized protein n=1 Tax=Platanthera guangdongensis TaxID=2320717 RepID=A0ABR2MHU4_9ASPA